MLATTIWLNLYIRLCFKAFNIQTLQVYLSTHLEFWLSFLVLNSSSICHFVRTHELQFRKLSRTHKVYLLYIVHGTTTSVLKPTRKNWKLVIMKMMMMMYYVVVFLLLLLLKELLNALYKYTVTSRKTYFISCVLTLNISIDIDQHRAPSTYPQTLERILLSGRFLDY